MKFDIDITDAKVATFSNQAKDELKTQIDDISIKLVDEALRIETSERLKGDKHEVTSSIVQKALKIGDGSDDPLLEKRPFTLRETLKRWKREDVNYGS